MLGAAKFSDDVTVTHCDGAYMRRHYEITYNGEQAAPTLGGSADHTERVEAAQAPGGFRPMYLVKAYEADAAKLEMSFDCTHYQAQFPPTPPESLDNHVFQSIFLNQARDGHLWTEGDIDPAKVIRRDVWHQLCHSWTHYVFVVPWLWLLQGRRHVRFASSWTVVNAHEVAVMSGIAAAVNLGARYPEDLERDGFALLAFRLYYLLVYGRWYRRRAATRAGPGDDWGSGPYGSVYQGPGLVDAERQMWRDDNGVNQ